MRRDDLGAKCRGDRRRRRIRTSRAGVVAAVLIPLSACGVAPSVNILGSFFPAWLISIVIGVILAALTQQAFVVTKIAPHLTPAAVVYPCLVLLWTCATWLVLFAS